MRIKMTPAQTEVLRHYLPDWVETADIVLGKTYADIEDTDIEEVFSAYDRAVSLAAKPTGVAWRVHALLRDARNGAESNADGLNEGPEGQDTGEASVMAEVEQQAFPFGHPPATPELPHPLMMNAAAVARGDYGPEAQRLAEAMDDRPGERVSRWIARLRHKLNSAGLFDAADALRFFPDV